MNFLELCCQCKVGNWIFLAPWSQVVTWPSLVHPWRLRSLHPWWWERNFRENNIWTWRVYVDFVLKTCRALTIIIFNDIGLYWGKWFGHIWTHFLRYNGGFFSGFLCGGSDLCCKLSATLKIYLRVAKLGLFGSRRCWKMALEVMGSSRHRLVFAPRRWHFLKKNYKGVEYCVGKILRNPSGVLLLFLWHIRNGTYNGSFMDRDTILLLHVMPKFLSQLVFH